MSVASVARIHPAAADSPSPPTPPYLDPEFERAPYPQRLSEKAGRFSDAEVGGLMVGGLIGAAAGGFVGGPLAAVIGASLGMQAGKYVGELLDGWLN